MLVIQSKKTDYNRQISKIENKITTDHDHNKYSKNHRNTTENDHDT